MVIYDSNSKAFPAKGAFATAPSTLFSIIFEKEFSSAKTLARSPVLLVGGYDAWSDEQRKRSQNDRNGAGLSNGYNQVSKGLPPALPYVTLAGTILSYTASTNVVTNRLQYQKNKSAPSGCCQSRIA